MQAPWDMIHNDDPNIYTFTKKEFFCDSQYGFRKQHSTQHAILDIINEIQDNMDKKCALVVFLLI